MNRPSPYCRVCYQYRRPGQACRCNEVPVADTLKILAFVLILCLPLFCHVAYLNSSATPNKGNQTMTTFELSNLNPAQTQQRSNIRNAWFCESFESIRSELQERLARNDFFAAAVLVELMSDYADDE